MNQFEIIQFSSSFKGSSAAAKHRRSKRDRRGCTLPSDYLSRKELKSMNGDVTVINMDNPTYAYAEFCKFSPSSKKIYLERLKDRGITVAGLAEHWGVSRQTARFVARENAVTLNDGRRINPDVFKKSVQEWKDCQEKKSAEPDPVASVEVSEDDSEATNITADVICGSITMVGTAAMILEKFFNMAPQGKLKITISYEVMEDPTK